MSDAKELIFEEEARLKLKEGIDILADVAGVTIGPKGRNVGIDLSWGAPKITNDGNSVIKDIDVSDQYVNMGISMGKEVASKIKEVSGDGTTAGILLLRSIVAGGIKHIASGASPILIKRGIEKGVSAVLEALEKSLHEVKTDEEIENIATVSASGNRDIGKLIGEALQKAGRQGVITIEEGKTPETYIDMREGMQFDKGYASSYFCTDREKMRAVLNNASVLITDKKINSIQEILPILQQTAAAGKTLLIIAEDIDGDALSTLVVNVLRGTLKVCAVKAPGFGDRRKEMLQDLAALTGATVVSEEIGIHLKDATFEVLGEVEKCEISKEETMIVGGKGCKKAIATRIQQIDAQIKDASNDYEKQKLATRKAKLQGGVAVIYVGGSTEPEMKQKKQMFEDSLNSTQAALEKGIVPGGCVALLKARCAIDKLTLDHDEKMGAAVVKKACEAPFRQLVSTVGFDPSVVLDEVMSKGDGFGFNVSNEKIEDMMKAGVIDPANVIMQLLRIASSAAAVVLLCDVLIGNAPKEEDE
ncbi:MAG: chaperonin GroEL [Chlamydiia bacterium]|nr:chaperonin GroEL [Chlamydiia bacterium]